MEAQWICDRSNLRTLMHQHPHWTNPQYAQAIGRSVSWVKKGKTRLSQAPAEDLPVLFSRSRARAPTMRPIQAFIPGHPPAGRTTATSHRCSSS